MSASTVTLRRSRSTCSWGAAQKLRPLAPEREKEREREILCKKEGGREREREGDDNASRVPRLFKERKREEGGERGRSQPPQRGSVRGGASEAFHSRWFGNGFWAVILGQLRGPQLVLGP